MELYKPHRGEGAGLSRNPIDPALCAVGVWSGGRASFYSQCSGKAKFDAVIAGKAVRVCTTHSPEKIAERAAAKQERYDREQRAWDRKHKRPSDYREALQQIAAGHNDPRALATAVLEKWNDNGA